REKEEKLSKRNERALTFQRASKNARASREEFGNVQTQVRESPRVDSKLALWQMMERKGQKEINSKGKNSFCWDRSKLSPQGSVICGTSISLSCNQFDDDGVDALLTSAAVG
ncbi:hypothetical protein CDAR_472781, partial [Caerostris darwini]